jgi:DNA-directed RNA polymerase subunit RPC12/RpoP
MEQLFCYNGEMQEENKTTEVKCPNCHKNAFIRGTLASSYGAPGFWPEGKKMWLLPYTLNALVCTNCGHVQFVMGKSVLEKLKEKLGINKKDTSSKSVQESAI